MDMGFPDWATTPSLSPDENTMYYSQHTFSPYETKIYRSSYSGGLWQPGTPVPGLGGPQWQHGPLFNGRDLYFTEAYHDIWSARYDSNTGLFATAQPVASINTVYAEQHAWVSRDGSTMVFGSDRPGGYGGADLWTAEWNHITNQWINVTNLGPIVNTASDEWAPLFAEGAEVLYFSRSGYEMQVNASIPQPGSLAVLDIRPGACPNPLNRRSRGVLPVALVGGAAFDVSAVDRTTLRLRRPDGVGGEVAPHEGPPGPHTTIEDAATPFDGETCACHDLAGDDVDDLMMHFRVDDLVSALELDALPDGSEVALVLTGMMTDRTSFSATDCMWLVPPGPAALRISSDAPGAFIDVGEPDETLDAGGFESFERSYLSGTVVTLTAPPSVGSRRLIGWTIDGVFQAAGQSSISLTIGQQVSVTAMYESRPRSKGVQSVIQEQ
ncbi:MAG TPA: hypothetical protein VJZ71_20215 [Phycisphaerae bacterium]|nr:hypothetical protein [Phycisphaerae bacterium]